MTTRERVACWQSFDSVEDGDSEAYDAMRCRLAVGRRALTLTGEKGHVVNCRGGGSDRETGNGLERYWPRPTMCSPMTSRDLFLLLYGLLSVNRRPRPSIFFIIQFPGLFDS